MHSKTSTRYIIIQHKLYIFIYIRQYEHKHGQFQDKCTNTVLSENIYANTIDICISFFSNFKFVILYDYIKPYLL